MPRRRGGLVGACEDTSDIGRGGVGVLEDAGLVRDVEEVLVGRPRLGGGLLHGDLLLGGVGEEGLAAGEAVVELGDAPGRDDLGVVLEAVEGELEADLVIALACAAVRDVIALLLVGDGHHAPCDDGPREGGAEEVYMLVTESPS